MMENFVTHPFLQKAREIRAAIKRLGQNYMQQYPNLIRDFRFKDTQTTETIPFRILIGVDTKEDIQRIRAENLIPRYMTVEGPTLRLAIPTVIITMDMFTKDQLSYLSEKKFSRERRKNVF